MFMFLNISELVVSQPVANPSSVKQLRARFDPKSDSIYAEWNARTAGEQLYIVRYKFNLKNSRESSQWRYTRVQTNSAKLHNTEFKNGDEIEVQVREEDIVNRGYGTEWSKSLIIHIAKRESHDSFIGEEEINLTPPTNFKTHILGTSSLKLEWDEVVTSHRKHIYYIVIIRQISLDVGDNYQRQQIKIEGNNFALENLGAGEKYEITIRSAISSQQTSTTAAVAEVTMPRKDEFFEVENVIIKSKFKSNGQSTTNVSWEVPANMKGLITAYNFQYTPKNYIQWMQKSFRGDATEAILSDLLSDTEYILRIRTTLRNNIVSESGEVFFVTPKLHVDTLKKVDVIFSNDMSTIRLKWITEEFINEMDVQTYTILISPDKNLPLDRWRVINLDSNQKTLSIDALSSDTTYFVRINIKKQNGQILDSPSIYTFKTSRNYFSKSEMRSANTLSYRNVGPGTILINWSYDDAIKEDVVDAIVYFSKVKTLPFSDWQQIHIKSVEEHNVILSNLLQGTTYFVEIVPRSKTNKNLQNYVQSLEIKTDILDGNTNWKFPYFKDTRQTVSF
uniref:Protein-tyrosine-phosphatase n=1 Tax=Rhabditophanes sp. KR3021 TaxID=114890 RepID=A0AC35U769_9BILA